jgi:2-polyprenyl-3-methyl-5-hydroxy-6-metoxy-1,4-benzoquinol methylase
LAVDIAPMRTESPVIDRSREMDEKSWWDLWNTSYRAKDDFDLVSSELFTRAAAAVNAITSQKASRVLEIACGTGALSRMLVYSTYHGLDISPAAIDIARQRSARLNSITRDQPPTYEAADFCEWPMPAQPFDVAVCVDAISSIRDQSLAMKKIAGSVRAGGHLVLTTINRFVYDRIQRSPSAPLQNGPVSHWLMRGELHDLIRSAGLTIERSSTIMPRGNLGILRVVNSSRLNYSLGSRVAGVLRRLKEDVGLGQYSVVVARKDG